MTAAPDPGLCATCAHAERVRSVRGSEFWLCARSRSDDRYRKYPSLPVVTCAGHERGPPVPPTA